MKTIIDAFSLLGINSNKIEGAIRSPLAPEQQGLDFMDIINLLLQQQNSAEVGEVIDKPVLDQAQLFVPLDNLDFDPRLAEDQLPGEMAETNEMMPVPNDQEEVENPAGFVDADLIQLAYIPGHLVVNSSPTGLNNFQDITPETKSPFSNAEGNGPLPNKGVEFTEGEPRSGLPGAINQGTDNNNGDQFPKANQYINPRHQEFVAAAGKKEVMSQNTGQVKIANQALEGRVQVVETPEMIQTVPNVSDAAVATTKATAGEVITQARAGENTILAQLSRAIVDQVSKDAQGQTNVRLRLYPAELGEVVIRIVYREGNITTHFQAASEQVKHLIEGSLPQLRETLSGMQFNLQNASVSVGTEGKGHEHSYNQQRGKPGQPIKISGGENTISGPESATLSDTGRLNYFV